MGQTDKSLSNKVVSFHLGFSNFSGRASGTHESSATDLEAKSPSIISDRCKARLLERLILRVRLVEERMNSQIVSLPVSAEIPIDCDFWPEDDGWNGFCKSPRVTVRGSSFEDAKKKMATELQAQIVRILHEHSERGARKIA